MKKVKQGKKVSFREGEAGDKREPETRVEELQKVIAGMKENYKRRFRVLEDRLSNIERMLFEKKEKRGRIEGTDASNRGESQLSRE